MDKVKFIGKVRNFLLMFIFFAISGWIYEVLWVLYNNHELVNRGYLLGPWLPVYGFGGMIIYLIFKKIIDKPVRIGKINIRFILLFVYVTILATIIELLATYAIELAGVPYTTLWDYSDHAFNFQGRVCLDASARFGVLGLVVIYGALPLYNKFVKMKNEKLLNIISWTLIAIFAIDWISRIWLGNNYAGPV